MNYDWTITIDGVDVSPLVKANGTIDYGRPTAFTAFQAPQAVFEMFTQTEFPNYGGTWPTVDLGDPVIIHVTWDGVTQWRRFTGVVQALDWAATGLTVTCTGTATDWQTLMWGDTTGINYDISNELETDRVTLMCGPSAALGADVDITIEGAPARRVRGIARDTQTGQPLLDSILRVADDCDALLMEDRLGVMHYRTRNFDRPAPYTLPAAVVERDSIDLVYERGTHRNAVRVFYGEPLETTGQQTYVYSNDTTTYGTIVTVGERIEEIYTDIQYLAGATGKARVFLERNRREWAVPDVTLLMNRATGAQADAILDLQENFMVTLGSLPTGCPIASYSGDILGMTDIMSEGDYRIILHLGPRMADTGGVPEVDIFEPDSMSGGTEYVFEDEYGFLWQSHVFDTPGSYTLTCNTTVTGQALVIAGGGGGGPGSFYWNGGGGGAGAVYNKDLPFTPGTIAVTVGSKGTGGARYGADGTSGTDSSLADVIVYGGGHGGRGDAGGADGGYGGAGGVQSKPAGAGLYGSTDGGLTTDTVNIFGGPGGTTTSQPAAGGGWGQERNFTGTPVTYAKPGAANNGQPGNTPGSGGSGGFDYSYDGSDGIVAYRYRIG